MAEYALNRARLATSPMNVPYNVPNEQSQILHDGVIASAPLVALAYSYATMTFEGNATHGGNRIDVQVDETVITLTLDYYGQAEISLLPFIRQAVLESGALDNPLYCESEAIFQQNYFRGGIDVIITEDAQTPVTMHVDYIFGNYPPKGQPVENIYLDYDYCDSCISLPPARCPATNYNANGAPINFDDNWCDINKIVEDEPTGNFILPLDVAWYYGKDSILFSRVNYHFRYDCRTENVMKVRWLDTNGNINTRKFTLAGISNGAAVGETWRIPHATKEISLGYDRGKDEWATITPQATITLGDDAIPIEHYEWLKSLASTEIIEVLKDGVWQRCNITGNAIECDPRKSTFTITLALSVPTDDGQQF